MNQRLVLVYNTKSGFMHSMLDLIHKTSSPKTYPCKLCALTYSGAMMNKLWKRYVASLSIASVCMHRDEFNRTYPNQNIDFPAIFLEQSGSLATLISSDEFKNVTDLSGLMDLLTKKLQNTQLAKKTKKPKK